MHINQHVITNIYRKISFLLILALPVLLYVIPVDWYNKEYTLCLFKNIFGIDCYGCGITRAILSAIKFDFVDAMNYNKMVIIVLPILIYTWLRTTILFYEKSIT
jgi:hypothetical protein